VVPKGLLGEKGGVGRVLSSYASDSLAGEYSILLCSYSYLYQDRPICLHKQMTLDLLFDSSPSRIQEFKIGI